MDMFETEIKNLKTTLGTKDTRSAVFQPTSIAQLVRDFPDIHRKYKAISVFSRGKNWGYGCQVPNDGSDLVIDLSQCRQILNFDSYHGTITIEPGVSYGELARYLKEQGGQWLAPVHGGGPNTSVMGNALERGYGITPNADHFGAVISLAALLENGDVYRRSLHNLGLEKLDKLFKYGLGPYYDGLFTQSGIGIVTEMTIRLAAKPSYVEMFYFNIEEEYDLASVVDAIKKTKRQLGTIVGGINLINTERSLSMLIDYPLEKVKKGEPLSCDEIDCYARAFQLTPWLVVGMLYGEKPLVKAAKKEIKDNFRSIKKRSLYFNTSNKYLFYLLEKTFYRLGLKVLGQALHTMAQAYEVLLGTPNNVALKLAYWKNENKELVTQDQLDPSRDDCGLIWYSPLVEMKPDVVLEYVKFVRESSLKYNINPLITLSTIDDLCFDSTVPILFNKKNEDEAHRAVAYYDYLLEEGRKRGFFPYRLNIETQKKLNLQNSFLKFPAINPNRYK